MGSDGETGNIFGELPEGTLDRVAGWVGVVARIAPNSSAGTAAPAASRLVDMATCCRLCESPCVVD